MAAQVESGDARGSWSFAPLDNYMMQVVPANKELGDTLPLAAAWEIKESSKRPGRFYFRNKETGATAWKLKRSEFLGAIPRSSSAPVMVTSADELILSPAPAPASQKLALVDGKGPRVSISGTFAGVDASEVLREEEKNAAFQDYSVQSNTSASQPSAQARVRGRTFTHDVDSAVAPRSRGRTFTHDNSFDGAEDPITGDNLE